jgi:hypothetical protein
MLRFYCAKIKQVKKIYHSPKKKYKKQLKAKGAFSP